jgi:hypothetical protein
MQQESLGETSHGFGDNHEMELQPAKSKLTQLIPKAIPKTPQTTLEMGQVKKSDL